MKYNILVIAVQIQQFTLPVTELKYPAITICKSNGFADPGEYLRSVFNNFQLTYTEGDGSCNGSSLLRDQYQQYIGDGSCNRTFYYKLPGTNPLDSALPRGPITGEINYAALTPENLSSLRILWIETLMKALNIWQHRMPRQL